MSQKLSPTGKSIVSIWVIMTVLSLGGSFALIWAVIHFARKYW